MRLGKVLCLAGLPERGLTWSQRRPVAGWFLLLVHLELALDAALWSSNRYFVCLWIVSVTVPIFKRLKQDVVGVLASHGCFAPDLTPLFWSRHPLEYLRLCLNLRLRPILLSMRARLRGDFYLALHALSLEKP